MTVKVEMERNEKAGMIAFQFTSSNNEDLDVIDALRTALAGDFAMRGAYTSSNVLVLQFKVDEPKPE